MKLGWIVASGGVLFLVFAVCIRVLAQTGATVAERSLFEAANRERKAQGLLSLRWNQALTAAAHDRAEQMVRQNSVSHRLSGEMALPGRAANAGAHFRWLSENIVQTADAGGAHSQFMRSPTPRANILVDSCLWSKTLHRRSEICRSAAEAGASRATP
jgi:hypothetical protein